MILGFLIVGCSSSNVTTLPTAQQNPNQAVPTTSTQMALPPTAAETSGPAEAAKPSNPGGPGQAVSLTGDPTKGQTTFTQICAACHGPNGTKGIDNPGSNDGTVPVLNPIDATIANADPKVFATNMDLFVEHGSTPAGPSPATKMPAFGDTKILTAQQIADVLAYVIQVNQSPAAAGTAAPNQPVAQVTNAPGGPSQPGNTEAPETPVAETAEAGSKDVPKPSNPGGTGAAVTLTGDATKGQATFTSICAACHGPEGKQGIANPGSNDGTVPTLNPIDPGLVNVDPKIFAQQIDLFIEHGSTPEGPNPATKMPAFGDTKILTAQQIADVIAYVISLNPAK
ncbi:MAG TPA: c-type cytochrome [Anaerolineaceae bacterium]